MAQFLPRGRATAVRRRGVRPLRQSAQRSSVGDMGQIAPHSQLRQTALRRVLIRTVEARDESMAIHLVPAGMSGRGAARFSRPRAAPRQSQEQNPATFGRVEVLQRSLSARSPYSPGIYRGRPSGAAQGRVTDSSVCRSRPRSRCLPVAVKFSRCECAEAVAHDAAQATSSPSHRPALPVCRSAWRPANMLTP